MRKHITGFSNPAVKYLRSLRDKKHRKRAGQFLVEGLRLLEDARACGRVPKTLVLAEGREHALLARLEADVMAAGGEVIATTPDILSKITGKQNAQAVAGVGHRAGAARPQRRSDLAGCAGLARSGQSGNHAAHGRCGGGRRPAPHRRLRRPLQCRSRPREHGGGLHRRPCAGAVG
jgi:hypothetical protein